MIVVDSLHPLPPIHHDHERLVSGLSVTRDGGPDRRFDYVLSAWPRRGGVGHPTLCRRLGVLPPDQPQLSDHYGVLADLRY
jgi:hypothetical protein